MRTQKIGSNTPNIVGNAGGGGLKATQAKSASAALWNTQLPLSASH